MTPAIADIVATLCPAGLFLGRLANFVNGELWGRQTDLPWGVIFCNRHIAEQSPSRECPAEVLVPRHHRPARVDHSPSHRAHRRCSAALRKY